MRRLALLLLALTVALGDGARTIETTHEAISRRQEAPGATR